MKPILRTLLYLFLAFLSLQVQAQLDNSNSNTEKGKIKTIIAAKGKKVNKPKSIEVDGRNGFKKAYDEENEKLKRKQKEQDFNNKGILSQAKLNEARFLKAFKKLMVNINIQKSTKI
jgi:hypothetical protein